MSQYATVEDIENLGLPARVVDGDSGVTADVLNAHLVKASALIDSFMPSQYLLPLSAPYPDVLTLKCIDIAVYTFLKQRGYNADSPEDQVYRFGYEDALAWLTQLSKGLVHLHDVAKSQGQAQVGSSNASNAGFAFSCLPSTRGWS